MTRARSGFACRRALSPRLHAALVVLLACAGSAGAPIRAEGSGVTVGSKAFPESWVLAEALATVLRREGVSPVAHRRNLGGTEIVTQALREGSVDVYPEYTGTIAEVLLHRNDRPSLDTLREALRADGLGVSDPIGFNDGYALAVTAAIQQRYGLRTISDLGRHPELRLGLTHEFLGRADGWPGLARHYGLKLPNVRGIQHELAYGALADGKIDVTDIYTTDAQIAQLGLVTLADDRGFFPRYDAVWLYRLDLADREPRALAALRLLAGRIDEAHMIRANARVVLEKQEEARAAEALLAEVLPAAANAAETSSSRGAAATIAQRTLEHLRLVAVSLAAAVLIGIPLGVIATRSRAIAGVTLSAAGLLQTIPSLALLAFLIPFLGIGPLPALVALFLYSLLPIVRNTYVGLTTLPPALDEAARVIGLSPSAQLLRVRLPMASPSILAGIKTSAVINVGTATLAALIGAGGLGDPILSGIQLRQRALILQGAVPAALLALGVQWAFDLVERIVVPKGLRLPAEGG